MKHQNITVLNISNLSGGPPNVGQNGELGPVALFTHVNTVSADLQAQIITSVANVSSSIQDVHTNLQSQITTVSASIISSDINRAEVASISSGLNDRLINIEAFNSEVADLTGTLLTNSYVNTVSGNLSTAIAAEADARSSADDLLTPIITTALISSGLNSRVSTLENNPIPDIFRANVVNISSTLQTEIDGITSSTLTSDQIANISAGLDSRITDNTVNITNLQSFNSDVSQLTGSFVTDAFVDTVSGNLSTALSDEATMRASEDANLQSQIDNFSASNVSRSEIESISAGLDTRLTNVETWETQLSNITGSFATTIFVNAVSGSLSSTIITETSDRISADSSLDSRITILEGNPIPDIFRSEVADVSAFLQTEIDNIGNLDSQIAELTGSFALVADVASISSGLDTRIANNTNDINNLQIFNTEIANLTGTFATTSFVDTVSGNLASDISTEATVRASADINIQNQINSLQTFDSQVSVLTGSFATNSFVTAVSGNLTTNIVNEASARIFADSLLTPLATTANISSGLDTRIEVLESNPIPDIFRTEVADVSAYLQSEIDAFTTTNISRSEIASISAGLDSRITTNTNNISDIQLFDSQVSELTGSFATTSFVNTVSGNLASFITGEASARASADAALSTSISNEMSARISADTTLHSEVALVSSNLATNYYDKTTSDADFVHLTGDETIAGNKTLTGDLNILGNVNILGTTTTVNSQTLDVADNIINLNSNVTGAPVLDSGIEVVRGTSTDARLIWDETNDYWSAGLSGSESKIWTESNDGSGSGLDADLLDGHDSTYFATTSDLSTTNSNISNIQEFNSEVVNLTGTFTPLVETSNLTGAIQTQIDSINSTIGNIQTFDSQVSQLTGGFATASFVDTISGNLSTAIADEVSARIVADTLLTQLTITSAISAGLDNRITTNTNNISSIQAWDSQLASMTGTFATVSLVDSVSGNLQSQIDAFSSGDVSRSEIMGITAGFDTRISNIETWDSQLAVVTGSFATNSFVNTVSGNLSNAIAGEASARNTADTLLTPLTTVSAISAGLNTRVSTLESNPIPDIFRVEVENVSAYLQSEIDAFTATNISRSEIAAVSAGLDARITTNTNDINNIQVFDAQIASLTGSFITDSTVAGLTGNLQNQITTNTSNINNLQTFDSQVSNLTGNFSTNSFVNTVSGNLSTNIANEATIRASSDASLQSQINAITGNDINRSEVATISAGLDSRITNNTNTINDLQAFDVAVGNLTGSFATTSYVGTISGNLSTAIATEAIARATADTLLTPLTTTASISSGFNSRITSLEGNPIPDIFRTEVSGVSAFLQSEIDAFSSSNISRSEIVAMTAGLDSRITTNTNNITNIQTFDSQVANLTGTWTPLSTTAGLTGSLQNQINTNTTNITTNTNNISNIQVFDSQIATLTGNWATTSYINTISGNLSTAIGGESSARATADLLLTPLITTANLTGSLQGQINTNSTNITNAQTFNSQVANLTGSLATTSYVNTISGNLSTAIANEASSRTSADITLQNQINSINTFDTQVGNLTGGWALTTTVAGLTGSLQSQINSNITTLANHQTFDSQVAGLTGSFATQTYVNTISGNLSTAISGESTARANGDALLTPLTTTANLTGSLQSQINTNSTNINNIQTFDSQLASLTGSTWVKQSGDTITGTLNVSGALAVSSASTINGYTIWTSGNMGSGSGLNADLLDGLDSSYFTSLLTTANISASQQTQLNNLSPDKIPLNEDFLTGLIISNNAASAPWVFSVTTGTVVIDNTLNTTTRFGIVNLTANSGGMTRMAVLNYGTLNNFIAGVNLTIKIAAQVPNLSDATNPIQIRFGFGDLNTNADMNNGVYFEYTNTTSTNWLCKAAAGGVRQTVITTTPVVSGSWDDYQITFDATATSVTFAIDGTNVATISSGLPSGTSQAFSPFIQIKRVTSNGTLNRSVYLDRIIVEKTV